jgi:hypothetical protein
MGGYGHSRVREIVHADFTPFPNGQSDYRPAALMQDTLKLNPSPASPDTLEAV